MNADEIVKNLREWDELYLAETCVDVPMGCERFCKDKDCIVVQAVYLIESLQARLAESQRRERAHEAAIRRHYNDMTSQCFICYSCVNHDARQKAKWDGKKLEDYACSGCGDGKPNWKFDVERFMGQEGRK